METTELLARFKQFQKAVIVLLAAILATNIVALVWVLSRIKDIENRPVHVSSPGFAGTLPPVDGVLRDDVIADEDMAAQGRVGVVVTFRLASKIPGSQVILAYKVNEAAEWLETPMPAGEEPLTFEAAIPLEMNDTISYRLEQRVGGETVQVSDVRNAAMAYLVGNGDVLVDYLQPANSKDVELRLWQNPRSKIKAFQVAEVRLKINKTRPEEVALKDDGDGLMKYSFSPDGLTNIEVTVVYKDGQTRTRSMIQTGRGRMGLS